MATNRPPRTREVKARVSDAVKRDVKAIVHMRGPDCNESMVVREALELYRKIPDIAALIAEGQKQMDELGKTAGMAKKVGRGGAR